MSKIIDIAKETLDILGYPHLISNIQGFYWNNRFSSTLGRCRRIPTGHDIEYRIEFGSKLFSIVSNEQKIDTIKHELCHVVAMHMFYDMGHGNSWKDLCMQVGCEPSPVACVGENPFQKKQKRIPIRCSCRIHNVSMTKFNRILSGRRKYYCKDCKQYLRVEDSYARYRQVDSNSQFASQS